LGIKSVSSVHPIFRLFSMFKKSLSIAIGLTLFQLSLSANLQPSLANDPEEIPSPPCYVNDHTGTPLNVRAKPNGKIIARLKNKTDVEPTNSLIKGRWSKISFRVGNKKMTGWVLNSYLACQ
jgi:hypothetical protein